MRRTPQGTTHKRVRKINDLLINPPFLFSKKLNINTGIKMPHITI